VRCAAPAEAGARTANPKAVCSFLIHTVAAMLPQPLTVATSAADATPAVRRGHCAVVSVRGAAPASRAAAAAAAATPSSRRGAGRVVRLKLGPFPLNALLPAIWEIGHTKVCVSPRSRAAGRLMLVGDRLPAIWEIVHTSVCVSPRSRAACPPLCCGPCPPTARSHTLSRPTASAAACPASTAARCARRGPPAARVGREREVGLCSPGCWWARGAQRGS